MMILREHICLIKIHILSKCCELEVEDMNYELPRISNRNYYSVKEM